MILFIFLFVITKKNISDLSMVLLSLRSGCENFQIVNLPEVFEKYVVFSIVLIKSESFILTYPQYIIT